MWAMQKLRHYLLGRQFIVRVDHKPLVTMLSNKMNLMMEGWIDTILQFDFKVSYLPGTENELADALSRSYEESIKRINTLESVSNDQLIFEAERRGKKIPDEPGQIRLIEHHHALGHFGSEAITKELWTEGYWWPRIRSDVQRHIDNCIECRDSTSIEKDIIL